MMGVRDRIREEIRVRNIALDTETFDAEHLLVIRLNGTPIVTVGEPAGPGGMPSQFVVWKGTPEDESEDVIETFYVRPHNTVDEVWETAVRYAYDQAVKRAFKVRAAKLRTA